jgi:hypothetical protein
MHNEPNEVFQELQRISRRSKVTAWAACITATCVVLQIFFPQSIKELSDITRSLDREIATNLIDAGSAIVLWVLFLTFFILCVSYVVTRISRAKKPETSHTLLS